MKLILSICIGPGLLYLGLLGTLLLARPRGNLLGETLRLLPHLPRLTRRLAGDSDVPHAVRMRLWLLLGYPAIPIHPDPTSYRCSVTPTTPSSSPCVLRSAVRRAGAPVIHRHWPGTDDGLAALTRLTGLQLR